YFVKPLRNHHTFTLTTWIENFTVYADAYYPENFLEVKYFQPDFCQYPKLEKLLPHQELPTTSHKYALWLPATCHINNTTPQEGEVLPHNPYRYPHKMMIAPIYLTKKQQVIALFFSVKKLTITWQTDTLEELSHHRHQPILPSGNLTELQNLYLKQKIRFLLSPYQRKVFYATKESDLTILPFLRDSLRHEKLWLRLQPKLTLNPQLKTQYRKQNFIFHDLPKEPWLNLGEIIIDLHHPTKLTPYYPKNAVTQTFQTEKPEI
ncbi:MAG: hypothetical protein OXC40_08030, partial [Proteobacteria bacterium]|nr:hypothetical protein [Pseudomonadota bacterium]